MHTRIGIFGARNSGKSSLINALTGQFLAVVSEIKGTTTDPVSKAMELLPLGPVIITDTPGFDDNGELGQERVKQTMRTLNRTDIALLVCGENDKEFDPKFHELVSKSEKPYIIVHNKSDLLDIVPPSKDNTIYVSAKTGYQINELKELIAVLIKDKPKKKIVADILPENSTVVLVVPIDSGAPKGRLILPQQQVLRELLDHGHIALVCRDSELSQTLSSLKQEPQLVITDSQVFNTVKDIVPVELPLTSFSILFARYKGDLEVNVKGAEMLDKVRDGAKILISEGCTHHRQCDDIGTVKLPKLIRNYSGKEPEFYFTSGGDFPEDLSEYDLIIHCGGCMLGEAEMKHRISTAGTVPFTNYGTAIAYMNGILERSIIYSLSP